MDKNVDLGESYGNMEAKPSTKYYPTIQIPAKIDPSKIGKTVTLTITGKVTAINAREEDGKTKTSFTIEAHSCKLPKEPTKRNTLSGRLGISY